MERARAFRQDRVTAGARTDSAAFCSRIKPGGKMVIPTGIPDKQADTVEKPRTEAATKRRKCCRCASSELDEGDDLRRRGYATAGLYFCEARYKTISTKPRAS